MKSESHSTNNNLQRYFSDMGKYDVLTPEEEIECAQKMVDAYKELVGEMLKIPFVWWKIHDKWRMLKRDGKASNKLAEEYGNPRFSSDELTLQVDAHIESAIHFTSDKRADEEDVRKKIAYLFRAAGLSKQIYFDLIDETIAQPDSYICQAERDRISYLRDEVTKYHHKLVTANLRLVINFAKNFNNYGVPLADLIQEGNIGLMRAAEKFDPSRELKFSTYAAWWIRQSFIKALKKQGKTIRLPSHIHDAMNRVKRAHDNLYYKLNREPYLKEIAAEAELDVDLVERLLDLRNEPLSLETPLSGLNSPLISGDTRPKYIGDFIRDESPSPVDRIETSRRDEAILNVIREHLNIGEQRVIMCRFGLGGYNPHTLEEVAELIDLSRERVRQLESSALEKLRENASYLEEYNSE